MFPPPLRHKQILSKATARLPIWSRRAPGFCRPLFSEGFGFYTAMASAPTRSRPDSVDAIGNIAQVADRRRRANVA